MQQNIAVRDYNLQGPSLLDKVFNSVPGSQPVPYQLTMTLQTRADFGAAGDVQAITDHAIYNQIGSLPSSSLPNMTLPGGKSQTTGEPGQVTPKPEETIADKISAFFGKLENGFVLIVVGVILAVVLIIAGKHKGIV